MCLLCALCALPANVCVCVWVCVLKIMVCEHKHCASGKRSPLYTNSLWPFACFTNKSPSRTRTASLPLPHAVGVDVCQFRASMSHSVVIVALAAAAADAAAGSSMSRKRRRRRRRCLAATANVGTVTGVWNCKFANGASHRWVHPGPF